MPINYSIAARRKPGDKNMPPKYYAKMQARGTVSFDTLAEDIAYATTLTDGDVLNVLRALIKQIKKHLSDGKIVNLDALGSFQFQISGKGALTEEDYNTNLIQKVRIQYRPGRLIREVQNLSTLHFRKVEPLKKNTTEDPENNEGFEE